MTNELPGMQDKSDRTECQTDCDREAQEKMREEFERITGKEYPVAGEFRSDFEIGFGDGWQACAARSAETIARLEKQLGRSCVNE